MRVHQAESSPILCCFVDKGGICHAACAQYFLTEPACFADDGSWRNAYAADWPESSTALSLWG
jgi:hypothetical protein